MHIPSKVNIAVPKKNGSLLMDTVDGTDVIDGRESLKMLYSHKIAITVTGLASAGYRGREGPMGPTEGGCSRRNSSRNQAGFHTAV